MDDPSSRPKDRRYQATPVARPADARRLSAGSPLGTRRLTPTVVTLGIALGGSMLFIVYAIAVRDASQIPMLAAGSAVLGIVFSTLAVAGAVWTYRASKDGDGGRAFAFALLGGFAALAAAAGFATAVVLALVWRG
jgi:hypothetical protein